jgi:hypothetical protein
MGRRVDNLVLPFMTSLAGTVVNGGMAILWHHIDNFGAFVVSLMGLGFCGGLLMFNLMRIITASFDDAVDAERERLEKIFK